MKELFTIGEMARLFDTDVRTLRYYDEIGILRPEKVDGQNNYRYYSTVQFERMNTIKYLRALDMPLKKIECFLKNRDTDILMDLLREQHRATKCRMQELLRIQRKIENRMEQILDALESEVDTISVKKLPARRTAVLRKEIFPGDNLEVPIRQLERQQSLKAAVFLGKVGVSVAREDLLGGRYDRYSAIFVILEKEDQCDGQTAQLPAGEYLCVRFSGTHARSGIYYERLMAEMRAKGLLPAGDSVEITLVDSGMTADEEKFLTELQIPFTV